MAIPKDVMDVLTSPETSKMLATVDADGFPNVVPVWSISAVDPDTIAFAEVFIKHTKENLKNNKKAAIGVFKNPMTGYQIKGTCVGFQTSGPVFDKFSERLKSQANLAVKSVCLIKVDEVFSASPGANSERLA